MTEELLANKLRSLADDINKISEEAKNDLIFYYEAFDEREDILKNMYAKDYAPVKTSAPTGFTQNAGDRLTVYEEFVDGYTKFIDRTLEEYRKHINRKDEAGQLLTNIMSLPGVCSRILYYAYVRRMEIDDICGRLFMSKSTFYRYRKMAIDLLAQKYNETAKSTADD